MNLGHAIISSIDSTISSGSILYLDASQLNSYSGSGTSWFDLSGTGNTGTLTNGPVFDSGNGGSIFTDGTNDVVTTTNAGSATDNYTFSAWFKNDNNTEAKYALTRGRDGFGNGWSLYIVVQTNGLPAAGVVPTVPATVGLAASGSTALANNIWNYLTGVWTSSTSIAIYVNGVLASSLATAGRTTLRSSTNGWCIGSVSSTTFTSGYVAVAHVIPRALSADEIRNNFNVQKSRFGYNGVTTSGSVLFLDASNTLSYPGGTIWNNLAGSSTVSGSLISGSTFDTEKGGNIKFDGTDDYVDCNLFVNSITNVTIQCWVKITSTSMKGAFVKIGGGGNGYSIGVGLNTMDSAGNELIGLFPNVRWIDTNTALGTGWKMVNLVLNATSVPSIYLNGVLLGSYSGTNPLTPTTGVSIGRNIGDESAPPSARAFGGNIANVIIYNRALSATEIYTNYFSQKSQFD